MSRKICRTIHGAHIGYLRFRLARLKCPILIMLAAGTALNIVRARDTFASEIFPRLAFAPFHFLRMIMAYIHTQPARLYLRPNSLALIFFSADWH